MHTSIRRVGFVVFVFLLSSTLSLQAQSAGSAGTIYGTVIDASGAILPGASIVIENPVSRYTRQTQSDSTGHFQFTNLPLNPYHLTVSANGFSSSSQDVDVRSTVPITLSTGLKVGGTSTTGK
jgi:hypothetical protein